jgi:hypothetical protein
LPAPRLLILADPKMIPALAAGLREGGRFDVTALSLADVVAAQAAAERVEALAVFYGAPGAPLSAALQALAPKLRERGARVVAVLQREQATQRDDCFRAGASDLLFMPMPKDQFVGRLAASVGLAFAQDGGAPAPVAVAARSAVSRIERATVSAIGVESPAALSLKPGETVRLSWGAFQSWGLVVRGGPSAQIRFAGLAPDEEAKIQQWVKSGAQLAGAAAADGPLIPAAPPAAPLIPAPPPASAAAPRIPTAPIRPPGMTTGPITDRIAPTAGPPPGFVDRKPVRPQSRPAARPPITTPVAGSAPVAKAGAEPPRGAPAAPAPARPSPAQNGGGGLEALFEGEAAAPAAPAPQKKPVPQGPPWPGIIDAAACKEAALQLLTDDTVGHGVSAHVAASARKVTGMLSPGERASIDRTGPDGHFAQTLAARIALDAAAAEANRLASGSISPTVDIDALTAVTKVADEAAARLTKEANAAIGKGEVEHLQLITAASAALSRDLLNVKELADRFRGVTAAPRLGAGALDPDVVLPGQNPRPRAPVSQAPAPVKAELRDFRGLDHKPSGRGKGVLAFLLFAGAVAAVANGFYFGVPRQHRVAFEDAGVRSINVSGASAVVTVTPDWLAAKDANLPKLLQTLRARQVKKAVLMLPSGAAVGIIDTGSAKMSGAPSASK